MDSNPNLLDFWSEFPRWAIPFSRSVCQCWMGQQLATATDVRFVNTWARRAPTQSVSYADVTSQMATQFSQGYFGVAHRIAS